MVNLLLAFGLGFVLSRERLRDPLAEQTWLLRFHRISLAEAFMVPGLARAVQLSSVSSGWRRLEPCCWWPRH